MGIISLTTDYGYKDASAAMLKGRLLSLDPESKHQLVDISHGIEPSSLMEAAFVLGQAYSHFPKGSVHICSVQEVVPSGEILAVSLDGHFFLCANNGLISLIAPERKVGEIISIDFRESLETPLFPSRDIMAKAAIHLASGGAIGLLGRKLKQAEEKLGIRPRLSNDNSLLLGSVVYVDNFGNLITNISRRHFQEARKERDFEIVLPRSQKVHRIHNTYHEVPKGTTLALFNAEGFLEIAIHGEGSRSFNGAAGLLGVNVLDPVSIQFK